MEQQEKFLWLDEYLYALQESIGFMDLSTLQPTSWRHFQPLIAKEWLDWLWNIIGEAERQKVSYTELAKCFEPDLCREHLLFVTEDLKTAKWPIEKRLKVADFFYQLLKAQMPQGDLFGLNGSTKRHSSLAIKQIINEGEFNKGTPEIAREFGKLYNSAYNLGAALYLDFYMGKAVENWGPYDLGNGKILVIKEMRHLKPTEIWPNVNSKCEKIDLLVIYEGVKFRTDLIACHTQYEGDVISGLKEWKIIIDGKSVTDMSIIKNLTQNLGEEGSRQWIYLTELPEEQLLEKAVWIRCFCFDKVCDLLSLDWRPTQKLLAAVKGKTLDEGWRTWKQFTNKDEYNDYWRKIWDPREEFYP